MKRRIFSSRGASQITVARAIEIVTHDGCSVSEHPTKEGAYLVSRGARSEDAYNADDILNQARYLIDSERRGGDR